MVHNGIVLLWNKNTCYGFTGLYTREEKQRDGR